VQNVYEGILSRFYFKHDAPEQLILMEDGAPVHHGKVLELWRKAHGIAKLQWLPNSLDLNPIENLWKIMKDFLYHHKKPSNKQEMMDTIKTVWEEVSFEQLQNLIESMPNRMKVVISARGGSTRW